MPAVAQEGFLWSEWSRRAMGERTVWQGHFAVRPLRIRKSANHSNGSDIRVRFAPSPTGYLHIGGARTALFNWLFARHHGGKFVLRIEDTDLKRNTEEAMAAIYEGLQWLGLNWDEGPHVGGEFGPYLQSERTELYERYLKKLQDAGHIFEDQGAMRFRSPREHVMVDDIVCGKIDFDLSNPATHPDMTIRRPDGSWIFHFVNVIDDLEMKISHVIRGEDHLSNTAKHIEIIRASRRNAAAIRAYSPYPKPRRIEDEQTRRRRPRGVLHPARLSPGSGAQLSMSAWLVAKR